MAALFLVTGCHIDEHKNGDNKEVRIATPFGGLHVTTDQAAVLQQIGLAAYPGAESVKTSGGNDAANVDMSFGSFQLRVKAVKYRSNDPSDKVQNFYRDQLKRYGDVIECRNNQPVGTPSHTLDGLGCDKESGGHISVDDNAGSHEFELRAGSRQHMRIVSITPDGGGTRFSLVVLDLPGKMGLNDDEERKQ